MTKCPPLIDSGAIFVKYRLFFNKISPHKDDIFNSNFSTITNIGVCSHLNKDGREKTQKLTQMQDSISVLRDQLSKSTFSTLSSEERAQKLETILRQEQDRVTDGDKRLDSLRNIEFKLIQAVQVSRVAPA